MGRRKTNIKKKIAAKRKAQMIARMQRETQQALQNYVMEFLRMIEDEQKKQESYRWN